MNTVTFRHNWSAPDSRPRIIECCITGKSAYIVVEYRERIVSHSVSKALVKSLVKIKKALTNNAG